MFRHFEILFKKLLSLHFANFLRILGNFFSDFISSKSKAKSMGNRPCRPNYRKWGEKPAVLFFVLLVCKCQFFYMRFPINFKILW